MDNYSINNYSCPDCKEAKLQSDKNARKINEVIEQVNELISVNHETVYFIEEKANEIIEDVAEIKANEIAREITEYAKETAETKVDEILEDLNTEIDIIQRDLNETIQEIDKSKIAFDGNLHNSLKDRLDNDFNDLHQKVNDSSYLEYEGCNISANNTYYGLQKDTVIKGRTLQNCIKDVTNLYHSNGSYNNKWITLEQKTDVDVAFSYLVENLLLKPDTVYTMFLEIKENTIIDKDSEYINCFNLSNSGLGYGNFACNLNNIFRLNAGDTGLFREKFTYREVDGNRGIKIGTGGYLAKSTTGNNGKIVFRIYILEGDHTQTPLEELPFIEGIESVGESELNDDVYKISGKSCGKNLFNGKLQQGYWYNGRFQKGEYSIANLETIPVKSNTSYFLQIDNYSNYVYGAVLDSNENEISTFTLNNGRGKVAVGTDGVGLKFCTVNSSEHALTLDTKVQLEESTTQTPYEEYKESTYSYILDEPLRSLPNGVCDEIDLTSGVLTRRVGKVVIDGSENWYAWDNIQMIQDTHIAFTLGHDFMGTNYKASVNNMLCNNFMVSDTSTTINGSKPYRYCALNSHQLLALQFKIEKTALVSTDCDGFIKWLQNNPTTVYYELAEPTTEQLSKQQLKSFDTTTHIISDNKLMPIVSTKISSNVQAVVTNLMNEIETMSLEIEENNLNNIETNINQEERLTLIEMGVI